MFTTNKQSHCTHLIVNAYSASIARSRQRYVYLLRKVSSSSTVQQVNETPTCICQLYVLSQLGFESLNQNTTRLKRREEPPVKARGLEEMHYGRERDDFVAIRVHVRGGASPVHQQGSITQQCQQKHLNQNHDQRKVRTPALQTNQILGPT